MKYFSKPWFQNACSTSPTHIKKHVFLPKLSDLTFTSLSTASALELSLAPCVSCLYINFLDDILTKILMQFSVYFFINVTRNGISRRRS